MQIRQDQADHFGEKSEREFVEEAADYVARNYSHTVAGLPREIILARVQDALDAARPYGFARKIDLLTFIVLRFSIGVGFDRHPRVANILDDPAFGPERKLDFLFESLAASDWDAIAAELRGVESRR